MATKTAHDWFNTLLLSVVGFFAIQTYYKIDGDHETLAKHETRITVLENKQGQTSMGVFHFIEGILPDRIEVKED